MPNEIDSSRGGRTPKKRGGARPGAGRPKGSKNVLPLGAVAAIKSTRLRVPDGTMPEHAALADRALQRIVDVMEERVFDRQSAAVLSAARVIREEVCGGIPKPVAVSGPAGAAIVFRIEE